MTSYYPNGEERTMRSCHRPVVYRLSQRVRPPKAFMVARKTSPWLSKSRSSMLTRLLYPNNSSVPCHQQLSHHIRNWGIGLQWLRRKRDWAKGSGQRAALSRHLVGRERGVRLQGVPWWKSRLTSYQLGGLGALGGSICPYKGCTYVDYCIQCLFYNAWCSCLH